MGCQEPDRSVNQIQAFFMTQLTDLFNPFHIFKLGETTEETQITAPSSDDDRFMSSDESEIESDEEEREKR